MCLNKLHFSAYRYHEEDGFCTEKLNCRAEVFFRNTDFKQLSQANSAKNLRCYFESPISAVFLPDGFRSNFSSRKMLHLADQAFSDRLKKNA
jgi:hypothetical protein